MPLKSRTGQIFIALAILFLFSACVSDDEQVDSTPNSAVAQEEAAPIDAAKAELIYREAVNGVRTRHSETGVYAYIAEEIGLVEQALELNPGYVQAMEVLSWVYSTYPAYVGDDVSHEKALEYALEVFKANGELDILAYEILGAAMYANDQFLLGQQLFDKAIEGATDSEMEQVFRGERESLRTMHEAEPGQPPNSQ
jgi:tetratricopeptide (TPR) repeat protein